ncbi:EmrB/QacA subfamily drug resistance transporter [Branchiibius hedensis]|uniref:Drug resistance transporter, EmrB/QacA subfamily n=1 Tax=Branchiibius hedensis TaxID=672460 RepID=A0A2Y8ZVA1_9MICO|nr:MFS transporter [Branchiibius hedensis]PWJ26396.1 EmrB/QacA subfamily drug resistance transporter [Branchiibius hedensis]SSA35208.1 drug resistance transporter, EmrB/QacA subfamily [Branchiibius hedensis]
MTDLTDAVTTSPTPYRRSVLPVIVIALAAVVSAISSLNLAAPSIAIDLGADATQISWIVDAYALSFAALLLLSGAIGDRYGRRRALVAGLVVFICASISALFVNTPGQLIAVQAVLGAGAALVMPATLSTITSTFPPERRVRAVGTWAGVSGASAVLGLLAAGLLLQQWSWRSIFVFNLTMGLIALVGTVRFIPESADRDAPKLDLVGALLSVAGLAVLVYSIIEAPTQGWISAATLIGLGVGVVVLLCFLGWELRHDDPLLDPRLFRLHGFSAGSLSITAQFFGFFGFVFLMVQYLQFVLGYSALTTALAIVPLAALMMPAARVLAPAAADRMGTGTTIAAGLLLIAAGFAVLAQLDPQSSYWLVLAGLLPLGLGMGLAMTPATNAITAALPTAKQGVASAMNDLSRELGAALGIAVLGSILQSAYRSTLTLPGVPDPAAEQARSSLAVAMHMGRPIATQAQSAFTDGMSAALLWGAGLVTAAAVAAFVTLRGRHRHG